MKSSSRRRTTRTALADMPTKRIEDMLWAYRDRMIDLKKDERFRYILIFKNHGASAGATLEHSHSQLIALPIIPTSVLEEIEGCRAHYDQKERCIYCDILRQDLSDGDRVVAENPEFLCVTPFAQCAFPLRCGFFLNAMPATSRRARGHNSNSSRRFFPKRYDEWTRSSLDHRTTLSCIALPSTKKT